MEKGELNIGVAIELPPRVDRKLLGTKGRSGLLLHDMDEWRVRNQAQFGRDTSDYVSMVLAHRGMSGLDDILGIQEETRRMFQVKMGREQLEVMEALPFIRNIWVGEHVKLLTPEQAAEYPHGGQTALRWATINGQVPEMVARASNGYFYPATRDDIALSDRELPLVPKIFLYPF